MLSGSQESFFAKAKVKWFDHKKGFGFAEITAGQDAFVHISVLMRAGISTLHENDEIKGEFFQDEKGIKLVELKDVAGNNAEPKITVDGTEDTGVVKWFSFKKGYGFIILDSNQKDALIHKRILRVSNIRDLTDNEKVVVKYITTEKGFEITWLAKL